MFCHRFLSSLSFQMCSVNVTRATKAVLISFLSDNHIYGARLPVCRWPHQVMPASSSVMTECRFEMLVLLHILVHEYFLLMLMLFCMSSWLDLTVPNLVGGHGLQYRGVETGSLVFPDSLHLYRPHWFQVGMKYFWPDFLLWCKYEWKSLVFIWQRARKWGEARGLSSG